MSSDPKNPLRWLIDMAWAVFGICLLLWLAVWFIQQIWVWLLAALIVAAVVTAAALVLRWRRDGW